MNKLLIVLTSVALSFNLTQAQESGFSFGFSYDKILVMK